MSSADIRQLVLSLGVEDMVSATEEVTVFRPIIRLFFLGKAGAEVAKERVEEALDVFAVNVKAADGKLTSDCVTGSCNRVKEVAKEIAGEVWQRSESLESTAMEKLRRRISEFSSAALSDSVEMNELRAEIAQLRAEIAELRAARAIV
jgi:polyhydroxyalkanoate synthesis regulator phasin